jgi:hypothetical protein
MRARHTSAKGIAVAAALGMVLAWGGVTEVATAALITFNFEGMVTYADSTLSSRFSTADKLVGSYSFHSDAPGQGVDTGLVHSYELAKLSFALGGNTYISHFNTLKTAIYIVESDRLDLSDPFDSYEINSFNNISGPSVGPFVLSYFMVRILGVDLFPNGFLPLTPPSLSNIFSFHRGILIGFLQPGSSNGAQVVGELTSLTLAPVPVPGAVLLFGSGVLGLAAFKQFRRTTQA